MKIAVICTGTELLRGQTVNTNLAYLGHQLTTLGLTPARALVIGDRREELLDALAQTAADSDLIITTGGLGPTSDDLTREVVCEFFGCPLRQDRKLADALVELWRKRGRGEPPPELFSQAMVPDNAEILANRVGTAPGLWINLADEGYRSNVIVLLPGPPSEFRPMIEDFLLPRLSQLVAKKEYTVGFMIGGAAESLVQRQVEPLLQGLPVTPAYCASPEGVKVFLAGADNRQLLDKTAELKLLFGDDVLAGGSMNLVEEVCERLRVASYTVATAESCTGGMIAAAITDLPGASDVFAGSVVAYSNQVKQDLLGVSARILEEHGAVSAECAKAMVEGICDRFGTDCGIAATGVAGPGGATPQKPVGLVYLAARVGTRTETECHRFRGNRAAVRNRAQARALLLLRRLLIASGL